MMKLFAGKWVAIAVIVLAVGLTSYFVIQYIQSAEEGKVVQEIQEQQIKKREKIDEAVRSSPRTVDRSLQYLRDRESD